MSRVVRKGAFREKMNEGKKKKTLFISYLSKDKELNMKHVLAGLDYPSGTVSGAYRPFRNKQKCFNFS